MQEKFEENHPEGSNSSSSNSSSDEYHEEAQSASVSISIDSDAETDVVNTADNTDGVDDYNLEDAVSEKFYTESSIFLWPLYVNRGVIDERNIDLEAYWK